MICKKCGKEFDGMFCPDCGTQAVEEVTKCPKCGQERMGGSKFCAGCGFNFEYPQYASTNNAPKSVKSIFYKIYRFLIAGGMIFVGLVAMLCLTAPTLVEDFLGETSPLCTGFVAIGNGVEVDVPAIVVNASIMLLVTSLVALIYGAAQFVMAIKTPYKTVKKYPCWAIDGVISIVLLALGAAVASATKSDDLMDAKLGSGFAMCIVMGVLGILFLAARIVFELKFFKIEDSGLSQEQIAKLNEKKERKKLSKKQIMAIVIPVVAVVAIVAVTVPTVAFLTNIFRIGKVDKVNIGDSQEDVIKVLGEPYKQSDYRFEYYSDNYLNVLKQLDKLREDERSLATNMAKDDDDFDFDDEDFGEDKETMLKDKLRNMTYQYICVEFDSKKTVSSVFFDNDKNDSRSAEESKKQVKSARLINKDVLNFTATNINYSAKLTDGSYYKGIAISNYIVTTSDSYIYIKWYDKWNNEYSNRIDVKSNADLLYAGYCGDKVIYVLKSSGELVIYGSGEMTKEIKDKGIEDKIKKITFDENSQVTRIYGLPACSSLTSIEIPDSVTSIGNYAFSGWSSMTSIEIPISVISIEQGAFKDCSSLTSIEIPSEVTSIGYYAFEGCSSLASIAIPSGVTSIGGSAFEDCSSLTNIVIPSGVTNIDKYTFEGCSSLTSIVIPSSVTSIDRYAFSGCSSLTSIDIPSGVTSIGESVFSGCSNLTSIDIPSGVTSIASYAFSGCSSLTSIEMPSGVTYIGSSAFRDCSSLTGIVIPSGVTYIGSSAFSGCSSLTIYCEAESKPIGWHSDWKDSGISVIRGYNYVTNNGILYGIKNGEATVIKQPKSISGAIEISKEVTYKGKTYSVTRIDSYVFRGWSSMTSIEIPSSVMKIGTCAFEGCSSLTSINIPSGVISIGFNTFEGCSSLSSIVIPSSVTIIADNAFKDCSILTIYCEAESEPSGWYSDWNSGSRPVVWGYKSNR